MYAVETKHDTVLIENCLYGDVGAICCQWSIHHVVVVVGKLWTSPEILRENFPPPRGTQRGDVYSFSIISFEIMMRSEPYSFDHMTARGPYHMTARRLSTTWPLAVLVLRSYDRSRSLPHDRSRSFDHMTARRPCPSITWPLAVLTTWPLAVLRPHDRSPSLPFDHMTARGPYHMTARRPSTTWPLAVCSSHRYTLHAL